MSGVEFKQARRAAGWTQAILAKRLRVTQAYVSLLERGKRPVPVALAHRLARSLRLPPTLLPLPKSREISEPTSDAWVEESLAKLGYPGYAHRRGRGGVRNPFEVLLRALSVDDLDQRLLEALPWLLLRFGVGDPEHLVERARFLSVQNRLGFTAAIAEQLAERQGDGRAEELRELLVSLEPFRLAREDTLGRQPRTERMRKWLRGHRSPAAVHWNILSDLAPEQCSDGV